MGDDPICGSGGFFGLGNVGDELVEGGGFSGEGFDDHRAAFGR